MVAGVGETAVKPRIRREGRAGSQPCSCGASLSTCPFWQQLFEQVTREASRFDAEHWTNDYRFEQPWLDRLLTRETSSIALRRVRRWAARHLPGYRQRVARINGVNVAFVRAVLSQTGATVFIDTSKVLTRLTHLLEIEELDVKVVWFVRDVRGFAWSARRRGLPMEGAAQTWRNDQEAIVRGLSALPPDRTLQLRYEDLCQEPRRTLHRLWEFCGVAPMDVPLTLRSAEQHVLGNHMRLSEVSSVRLDEGWSTGLSDDDQRRILSVADGMHQHLRY